MGDSSQRKKTYNHASTIYETKIVSTHTNSCATYLKENLYGNNLREKAYSCKELPDADFIMGVNSLQTNCMTISLLAVYPY
jgi:hypothetical protein